MKKLTLLLSLLIIMACSASAQESIMSDISEAYIAKLVARAEANYPQIKSNQSRIDIAQTNIGKAKVSYLDALTVSYVYQPNGFNSAGSQNGGTTSSLSSFNGVQAALFLNLGTLFAKPYAVKEAKQQLEIANNEQDQYFLTITNQVKSRYYTYVGAIAVLKFATQSTIDAQSVTSDIKHKFEKGEDTFDNYTKAQTTLTTTYQARVQAETAVLIAKANLEELLGDKLENIK